MSNFKLKNGNLWILVIFPGLHSLYYRSSRIKILQFQISTVRSALLSCSCLFPQSFLIMIKKNVHRTFCPNYWDIIPNEGILASFRTFFLTRVGSYPLGSGQEMLRIMVLVHLLPSFLSLPRFYLIMGNSNSFFFFPERFSFIAS